MTTKCSHKITYVIPDSTGCFCGSVAGPRGVENPSAHGNIRVQDECDQCGSRRARNVNGRHEETGPWGPDAATRRAIAHAEARRARAEAETVEDAALAEHHVSVVRVRERSGYHTMVDLTRGLDRSSIPLWQVKAAADQPDTGDGLVQFYRGLLRAVATFKNDHLCEIL